MITAVDTSVLLDVFLPDPEHAAASLQALEAAAARGAIVLCPIVWAETATAFRKSAEFAAVAEEMSLRFDDLGLDAASLAADMSREYRRRSGRSGRVLADFLIGAHALLHADVLLARDRGYFRDYYHELRVESP